MNEIWKVTMGGLCGLVLAGVAAWRVLRPGGPAVGSDSDAMESPQPQPPSPNNKKMTSRPRLPPPVKGDHITVLSIDGGGIRGLIPAVVLEALERQLKAVEEEADPNGDFEDARIADYFDVIAGTSTGALIATMLTTPDGTGRPKFAADQIQGHYREIGPEIFPPRGWIWGWLCRAKSLIYGPKYDSTSLRNQIERITEEHTLADTLTNVVIPAFDVRRMKSRIFSSFRPISGDDREEEIPRLSDVCLATTAAPTYFKPHYFEGFFVAVHEQPHEHRCDFHLVDGGVGANNPTMVAISRIAREVVCQTDPENRSQAQRAKDFKDEMDYRNLVVISIGTGSTERVEMGRNEGIYKADDCAKFGDFRWIFNGWTRKPIIDMLMHASDFLVDYHVTRLLRSLGCKHYLRIQALGVDERCFSSLDCATEENMQTLVNIGTNVLQRRVYSVHNMSGFYQLDTSTHNTNDEELKKYAIILKQERDRRLGNNNNPDQDGSTSDGSGGESDTENPPVQFDYNAAHDRV